MQLRLGAKSAAVSGGRLASRLPKTACKVTLIRKPCGHRNRSQSLGRADEQPLGRLHADRAEIGAGAHTQKLAKTAVEVSRGKSSKLRHLCHRYVIGVVLLDVMQHRQ